MSIVIAIIAVVVVGLLVAKFYPKKSNLQVAQPTDSASQIVERIETQLDEVINHVVALKEETPVVEAAKPTKKSVAKKPSTKPQAKKKSAKPKMNA